MKNLSFQTFKNRLPLTLLSAALLGNGTIILWFVWHAYQPGNLTSTLAYHHTFWFVSAIILVMVITLLAWLATFRYLRRSEKTILFNDAGRTQAENALLQSEARFRDLIENANDLIYTTDFQGNFTSINKAGEIVTGYKKDEFCKMHFTEIVFPEYQKLARQMPAAKPNGEIPTTYEIEILTKTGNRVTLDISSRFIYEAGVPVGVQGIGRDITDRKQAEKAMRESEARYRLVTESASDAILTINHDQTILFVNSAAEKIFGYTVNEMLGKKLSVLIPKSRGGERGAEMKHYGETDEQNISSQAVELSGLHKNGGEIPLEITFGEINSDGKRLFTAIIRDITERKKAEEELKKNLSLLTSTFEATAEGILVVDLNNKIVTYNQHFIDMARIPDEVIQSMDNAKVINFVLDQLSNPDTFLENTKQLYSQPENRSYDVIELKDGRIFERFSHPQMMDGKVSGRVVSLRDITERKRAEEGLRQSEEKYRNILETIEEGYFEVDLEGVFTFYNKALGDVLRYDMDELLGMHYRQYVDDRNAKKLLVAYVKVYRTGQPLNEFNWEVICKDGTRRSLESSITLIRDAAGKAIGFRGLVRNVTQRKQTEEAFRQSEHKLRTLIASMREGLIQANNEEVIEFVNDYLCEMTGYERDELLGKNALEIFFDEEGREFIKEVNRQRQQGLSGQYEIRLRKKSGEMLWVSVNGSPIFDADGKIVGTMGVFADITDRKRVEEQLLHDAFHDNLTGLANRALFMDHLRMTIERNKRRHGSAYAVLFLDFDRFKMINDSLGHAEGDKLLTQIARRLESSVRTCDLAARFGGDEFVILLSELADEGDAVLIADRILNNLKKPFDLSVGEFFISASIGIALSSAGHKRAEEMVRDADIAMYHAKAKGKAQYQMFNPAMHDSASKRLWLETEMRQSLEREEFQLYYQPIINLKTENLVGFEAFVRCKHPTRGIIPPSEFIKEAEENGLILPLGNWILQESCRQLQNWKNDNPSASRLTMSVNLSCKQFLQCDLVEQIDAALSRSGLDPQCLKLEITESHILENRELAVTLMNQLRALGVEIYLDDFGTGYSSLSYLHRLPVDYLKIDRSFISQMTSGKENSAIVRTIIKMTQILKIKVIAEGIETAEQLACLKRLRCQFGQGYFFSKPLEAEAAEKFIKKTVENLPFIIEQDFGLKLNM